VSRVNGPPVVGPNIEKTQDDNKEGSRPLGFEANGNHNASGEPNKRNKDTEQAPFTLNDEAKEKEDKQDTPCEEEAVRKSR
jgi:hypothetical protein